MQDKGFTPPKGFAPKGPVWLGNSPDGPVMGVVFERPEHPARAVQNSVQRPPAERQQGSFRAELAAMGRSTPRSKPRR